MTTLLIPVGHDVGPFYGLSDPESPRSYDIRCGDGAFRLTSDQYIVWREAHGELNHPMEQEPETRESVEAAALKGGAAKAGPAFDELLSLGALLEINSSSPALAQRFADTHRVVPLQRGLGNSGRSPQLFRIAAEQGPATIVSSAVYHLWTYSHLRPSLWDACRHIATDGKDAGLTLAEAAEFETSPRELLTRLLAELPQLLAARCLY
ncbi:MAG: hypothetical protein ACRDPW_01685, partial [Mycobacteriales bacterium]